MKWGTIFLEYSIYLGSLIYGIGLAGIMCLQGKYIGECATKGPVGDYFGITFFNMSLATLISFALIEGFFHSNVIPLSSVFLYCCGVVVLIILMFCLLPQVEKMVGEYRDELMVKVCFGLSSIKKFRALNIIILQAGFIMGMSLGYRSIVSHSQFENTKITEEKKNMLEGIIATGEIIGVMYFTV